MKIFGLALWAALTIASCAHAETDRTQAATAAYRLFPVVLKSLSTAPSFSTLSPRQQSIFKSVMNLVDVSQVPLRFEVDSSVFEVNEGEARRWMRTPINALGEVDINLHLLNSPEVQVSVPFLLKIFFHEWAHKIDDSDQALRDSVAQFVETQAESYYREYELSGGHARLALFSIPLRAIDHELAEVSMNRPQPTNLLLVENHGRVEDYTEALLVAAERPSSVIRSLWSVLNNALFSIYRGIGGALNEMVKAISGVAEAFGVKSADFAKFQRALTLPVKELRTLELQDVESLDAARDIFVRIKSTWTVSRTERDSLPIRVTGFEMSDSYPVPLNIMLRIPKSEGHRAAAADFQISMRANTDLEASAKIQTVNRGYEGRVERVSVVFTADKKPRKVFLSAVYTQGSRLIEASLIEAGKNNTQWVASFDLIWTFLPRLNSLVAESILVESHKLSYLNRLLELNVDDPGPTPPPTAFNGIVPDSLGIRGMKDGHPIVFKNFVFYKPIFLLDQIKSEFGSLNPQNIHLEFDLFHEEKVREIRLQYNRTVMVVDVSLGAKEVAEGKTPGRLAMYSWDGEMIRMASSGTMRSRAEFSETLTVNGDQINRTDTAQGTQRVSTHFKAPFLKSGELTSASQGHAPPWITPIAVEVVLDSGQILTHSFGEALVPNNDCEWILR